MGDGVRSFWKTGVFVTCVAVICGAVVLWWGVHREKAIERTLAQTATLYRVRAEQGDAKAQFRLGYIYYQGKGVPQDYAEAVRWYRKAADQGYAKAQYDLGYMYSQGKGVPQDYREATRWYRKAADQGDTRAQLALGLKTRPGTPTKIGLSLAFVGSILLLIDSLLPNGRRIRNRQGRATSLTGLVGLSWVALNLYRFSDIGILQSVLALNAYYCGKDFLAGVFAVMLIFLLSPQSAKIMLGISGIFFVAFNLYAITHYELRLLAPAARLFYSANGLLIGTLTPSAFFLWLTYTKSRRNQVDAAGGTRGM